jgi:hypothetical protein
MSPCVSRAMTVALFLFVAALQVHRLDDADTWWHLATGRLIAARGAVPQSDPYQRGRAILTLFGRGGAAAALADFEAALRLQPGDPHATEGRRVALELAPGDQRTGADTGGLRTRALTQPMRP